MAPTRLPSAAACSTCWLGSVDVAGRVEARHGRFAGRVGLDEVAEPGRVRRGSEAERREGLSTHPEPRADHDCVGFEAFAVGQLDCCDVPVVAGDDATHVPVDDLDPGGLQDVDLRSCRRRRRRGARR